jgi:hypothetical protein
MFGQDRQQLRQVYYDVWHKHSSNHVLSPLEQSIAQVIIAHPEYHALLSESAGLQQEFFVENGQTNPFLHMGLHISLHEQISTNRPEGIKDVYITLLKHYADAHETEHQMMECLTESLWLAQRNQTAPSEIDYLNSLRALVLRNAK